MLAAATALRRLAERVAGAPTGDVPRPPHLADAPEHWLRMVAEHAPGLLRPDGIPEVAAPGAPPRAPTWPAMPREAAARPLRRAATDAAEAVPTPHATHHATGPEMPPEPSRPAPRPVSEPWPPRSSGAVPGPDSWRTRPRPTPPHVPAEPVRPTSRRTALPRVRVAKPAQVERAARTDAPIAAPAPPRTPPLSTRQDARVDRPETVARALDGADRPVAWHRDATPVAAPYPELPHPRSTAHRSHTTTATAAQVRPAPARTWTPADAVRDEEPHRWAAPEASQSRWPDLPADTPAGSARLTHRLQEWRADLVRIQEVG